MILVFYLFYFDFEYAFSEVIKAFVVVTFNGNFMDKIFIVVLVWFLFVFGEVLLKYLVYIEKFVCFVC